MRIIYQFRCAHCGREHERAIDAQGETFHINGRKLWLCDPCDAIVRANLRDKYQVEMDGPVNHAR